MKYFITALILLFDLQSYAYTEYVCKEIGKKSKGRVVYLTQTENKDFKQGESVGFHLLVGKKIPSGPADVLKIQKEIDTDGTATQEDVELQFTSKDGQVVFGIYLDELNESYLYISHKDDGRFGCEKK